MKTIIMYPTALYAEKLAKQLHRTQIEYTRCVEILEMFNAGSHAKVGNSIIYSVS